MISCTQIDDPFRCPTKWELWRQIMALLPRGRAWQTNVSPTQIVAGGELAEYGTYELGHTGLGSEQNVERLTVLQRYWLSYAEVLEYLHQRACALVDEMFCDTTRELRAEWGVDYGFPDPCEPFDNLCDKVRALGGSTCAYLAELAARLGYVIECRDGCDAGARADCMVADCTPPGCDCVPNQMTIRIISALSPSVQKPTPFAADALVADCTPVCPVPPDAVVCLIERFKPAHVKAIYEVV